MQFIDTHCHIDFSVFDGDRRHILENCRSLGVVRLLVPAVSFENWQRVLTLSGSTPEISPAIGIHPCFLNNAEFEHLDNLARLLIANRKNVIAVGEIGLDRAVDIPAEKQHFFFKRQLALAFDLELPVMLHSRQMNDEIITALKQYNISRGVVHGFAGSLQQAQRLWAQGMHLGVGGIITYPRAAKTRKTLAIMPLQSLLLETDAPDMPVCGFQGLRNTPERIPIIFAALCKLRSEPPEIIAAQLYENSVSTFGLDS
jgi:TatD DNase family protein